MNTNAAEELTTAVMRALPDSIVTIDAPAHDSGHWFIDIRRGKHVATVEWRPKQGFGLGLGRGEYGEGPDIVLSTVEQASRRLIEYLVSEDSIAERPVFLVSADFTWRSAVEESLRQHNVWADTVASFAEATNQVLSQTYLVVVLDLATELTKAYWDFRDEITEVDSLIVNIATSAQMSSLDDSFEFVVNRRVDADEVAIVIQGLLAAAAAARSSGSSSPT